MATLPDFVRRNPIATKRVLCAIVKAADFYAAQPERVAQRLIDGGSTPRYDFALHSLKQIPYAIWRVTTCWPSSTVDNSDPTGNIPVVTFVYTRGGHVVGLTIGENRKAPAAPNPTDTERAELFKSLAATKLAARTKVDGSKAVVHYDASWIQSWTGTDRTLSVEIGGNKLTVTSPRFKSTVDGQEIFYDRDLRASRITACASYRGRRRRPRRRRAGERGRHGAKLLHCRISIRRMFARGLKRRTKSGQGSSPCRV